MGKPVQRNRYKYKGAVNNCEICNECEYIGDGDFACMKYEYPVMVKEDWTPTNYYSNCKKCRDYIPNLKGEKNNAITRNKWKKNGYYI